jgi:hypothetical protein
MKSDVYPLTFFLRDSHQFRAPLYQRRYRWNVQKARIFWDDLLDLIDSPATRTHFFGAMVTEPPQNEEMVYTYNVIDGQQRIITLNLLVHSLCRQFAALAAAQPLVNDMIKDYQLKNPSQQGLDLQRIYTIGYLQNQGAKESLLWKFKPTVWDEANFNKILKDNQPADARANPWKVVEFFKEEITKELAKRRSLENKALFFAKMLRSLTRFQVSVCEIEVASDDPNQVFESLNSKGEKLSAVDLIRNLALLGFNDEVRKIHYEEIWKPMEACLTSEDDSVPASLFQDFVRSVLVMKKGKLVPKSEVFAEFKEQFKKSSGDGNGSRGVSADDLRDLYTLAKVCKELAVPGDVHVTYFDRKVFNLSQIGMTTHLPLLMKFKGLDPDTAPSKDQIAAALSVIERYFVRRAILNKGVHNIGELFALLARLYERSAVPNDKFVAWLLRYLRSENIKYREDGKNCVFEVPVCPSDKELRKLLPDWKAYEANKSMCRYVLATMEARSGQYDDSKPNRKEFDERIYGYDLDHVLPQSWTDHWGADLKSWYPRMSQADLVASVDSHVHQLGNLVLSDYNRKMKNRSFSYKKEEAYADNKCGVGMTREVGRSDKWTFEQIAKRSSKLTEEFIKIWPQI